MRPRARSALVALVALVAALAGCQHRAAPVDPVVFWSSLPAAQLEPVVREFERGAPGTSVRVVALPAAQWADSLAAALAAGHPPDLCAFGSDRMPALLASGALSDWSAGVADLRDSLAGWPACMVGDAIYGVPLRLDATTLCWNRTLFARAGLDARRPPGTWAEVRVAALRLSRLGGGVHGLGLATGDSAETFADFLPWAVASGGGLDASPSDSAGSRDAGNRLALDFLLGLRKATLCAGRDTLVREFAAGRLGMVLANGHVAGAIVTGMKHDVLFDRVAMPRAAADSSAARASASALVLASPARARHKEDALRLARYLAGTGSQLALHAILREGQPSSLLAESLLVARSGGGERGHAELLRTAYWPVPVAHWNAMGEALGGAVRAALLGASNPDTALADAAGRIAALGRR